MKLSTLSTRAADNAGVPFSPVHPVTGEEIDVVFTLISKNSDVIRKKMREFQDRLQRDPKFLKARKLIDMEQVEMESTESIALCITGWKNLDDDDGNPIAYSHDAAIALVSDPGYSWIRNQIDSFTGATANFFTNSAASSTNGPPKSSADKPPQTPTSPVAVA